MPTAFLTGGTGFVGGHVARSLVQSGWTVRLLQRRPGRAAAGLLEGLPLEIVPGDLSRGSRLDAALEGLDAVVHVAGLTKARSLQEYREVNVGGTERLVEAAGRGSPRALFVLVSSQAAAGPATGGRPVAEGAAARPVSWYGLSKREGEEAVARGWRGPWIVLRPGVVYGPGDRALLSYFRMAAKGLIPVPAGRTRFQIIGGEAAGMAIARAASRPDLSGRIGFLCDPEAVSVEELLAVIAVLPPRRARLIRVPGAGVRLIGAFASLAEALMRRSLVFNADKAREVLAGDWLCDPGPIRRALSLSEPVPLAEGLRLTWDWYRAAGWLPGVTL
jgi:nucleoside-diphosphate-sugar epimerase